MDHDSYGWKVIRIVDFQAVERLQINTVLNACCVGLLESAIEAMRAAGATYPVHALLIMGTKLLAQYSP